MRDELNIKMFFLPTKKNPPTPILLRFQISAKISAPPQKIGTEPKVSQNGAGLRFQNLLRDSIQVVKVCLVGGYAANPATDLDVFFLIYNKTVLPMAWSH